MNFLMFKEPLILGYFKTRDYIPEPVIWFFGNHSYEPKNRPDNRRALDLVSNNRPTLVTTKGPPVPGLKKKKKKIRIKEPAGSGDSKNIGIKEPVGSRYSPPPQKQ
jgi:hypothetical protein